MGDGMNPDETIKQFEIEENRGAGKSAHTTNPTNCSDVRRSGEACGICGSFNVVSQGVRYCKSCGLEVEYLGEYSGYWWCSDRLSPICGCPHIEKYHNYKISPRDSYIIGKCLDCGAVNSSRLCPNCGNKRIGNGAWRHWDGRIKCRYCGYTLNNGLYCGIGAKANKAEGKLGTKKAKSDSKKYMSRRQRKRFDAKNRPHPNLTAADQEIGYAEMILY